jgi:hypothetical protein
VSQKIGDLKVKQSNSYMVDQYISAGCSQIVSAAGTVDMIGVGLVGATNGFMCNGCPKANNCDALRILAGISSRKPESVHSETVRDEAARKGISISEVRRQRNDCRASA